MIPNHNVIMVAGDFNAKLDQDEGFTHSFHRKTNRNGNLLAEMMTEHNLICLNTKFEKMVRNGPSNIQMEIKLRLTSY